MREIKFRGWMPIEKKLIYKISVSDKPINNLDDFFRLTAKDGFVWMQYTGLKDKNGVEIYEGDIVAYDGEGNEVVEYQDGCFWVGLGGELPAPLYAQMEIDSMEIVGNRFENPELLVSK